MYTTQLYFYVCVWERDREKVCVCVWERERKRERVLLLEKIMELEHIEDTHLCLFI